MEFFKIDYRSIDESLMDEFEDRIVFQTLPWLRFLTSIRKLEPIIAELRHKGETLGYFTGLIQKKFGVRILGSPFRGWTTPYMGFNLGENVSRADALKALVPFAFEKMNCHHLEVIDRRMGMDDFDHKEFNFSEGETYELDVTKDEEQIFAGFTSPARRCVRKAKKNGVIVEEAENKDFAKEYYEQFDHVVRHHGDIPIYGLNTVESLIKIMKPTGNLICLRAVNNEGVCIATGIFLMSNKVMFGWGLASWRHLSDVRPNEAILWKAMRMCKARGGEIFDFVGPGDYKKKFGSNQRSYPTIKKSRSESIAKMREMAGLGFKYGKRLFARVVSGPDKSGEANR